MHFRTSHFAIALALRVAIFGGAAEAQSLRTIVLSGAPVPGASGAETFSRFAGVNLSGGGDVVYYAELSGAGVNDDRNTGIWINGGGNTTAIAREGDTAFGSVAFGEFSLGNGQSLINASGNVLFHAMLLGDGSGTTRPTSLWASESGVSRLIVRDGDRAPDTPEGVRFTGTADIFGERRLSYSDSGKIAFAAGAITDGLNPRDPGYSRSGIWVDNAGTQTALVQSGDTTPSPLSGSVFQSFRYPVVSPTDEVIFHATTNSSLGSSGLWSSDDGSFTPIALRGEQAPGAPVGARFEGTFGQTTVNQNGEIAFFARLNGAVTSNDYAIWKGPVDNLSAVVFDRDPAPGLEDQVFESSLGNPFGHPQMNAEGDIAFSGSARQVTNSRGSHGVWATDNGALQVIASLDSQIPAQTQIPPVLGKVAFSTIYGVAFNDAGQVAFGARLVGEGIDDTNNEAIWAQDSEGVLQLVARKGDLLEVATGDFRTIAELSRLLPGVSPSASYRTQFNNLGQLAFSAIFTDGSEGVFLASLGARPQLPGDYNSDGVVDAADYTVWRDAVGGPAGTLPNDVDGGEIGVAQYDTWIANYGAIAISKAAAANTAVPEPTSGLLALGGLAVFIGWPGSQRSGAPGEAL